MPPPLSLSPSIPLAYYKSNIFQFGKTRENPPSMKRGYDDGQFYIPHSVAVEIDTFSMCMKISIEYWKRLLSLLATSKLSFCNALNIHDEYHHYMC